MWSVHNECVSMRERESLQGSWLGRELIWPTIQESRPVFTMEYKTHTHTHIALGWIIGKEVGMENTLEYSGNHHQNGERRRWKRKRIELVSCTSYSNTYTNSNNNEKKISQFQIDLFQFLFLLLVLYGKRYEHQSSIGWVKRTEWYSKRRVKLEMYSLMND